MHPPLIIWMLLCGLTSSLVFSRSILMCKIYHFSKRECNNFSYKFTNIIANESRDILG